MLIPPKVLVITREVLKPGKGAVHEKWEAGWPRAFAKAKWPTHYLAVASITGENRALYMTGYESLAAWEADANAIEKNAVLSAQLAALSDKDGDYLTELRTGAFTYLPELSYRPDAPLVGTRYFLIISLTVKPGHGDHFTEVRKTARQAHEKAGLDEHFAVYQAAAGAPAGLYLIFIPLKSLAEMDQSPEKHGKAYQEALGEEGRKKADEFQSQGLESAELQIFAFSPKMSYPSKEWIAAEPDFWAPKPAAAKPAAKKEEGATQ
jgi:hypothetical protein